MKDVVLVVTPTRNADRYLEETILSVVQQRGDFEVRYHVQDSGSTDSTIAIAKAWVERLKAMDGSFHGGARVQMSWASAADRSLYDAIQTGFDFLLRGLGPLGGRRVAMTWINADDVFTIGAFRTATSFLFQAPEAPWVTGIPSTITEAGAIVDVRDAPYAYSRPHLALGRYDGRSGSFLQQEGTFWTESLWSAVGGLNRNLRLAGDWDLWRRMARKADIVTLRAVLAHHRRHPGQLSAELSRYWEELEALKKLDDIPANALPEGLDVGLAAGCGYESDRWNIYSVNIGSIQELKSQLKATESEAALVREQREEALSRIAAIERSRSWRWTQPMRWASDLLKTRPRRG